MSILSIPQDDSVSANGVMCAAMVMGMKLITSRYGGNYWGNYCQ